MKKGSVSATTWSDLTVRDAYEISRLGNMPGTRDERNARVAAYLAGLDYGEMEDLPLDDYSRLLKSCAFLLDPPKPAKARRIYTINGRDYELMRNESKMTVSQYMDFTAISSEGYDKAPAKLLSVMLVPRGKKYGQDYDMEDVEEDMWDLKAEEALGIRDFFMRRFVDSVKTAQTRFRVATWLRGLLHPKEREMMRAMRLATDLAAEALMAEFGLDASRPSASSPE